jgi:hypothetical protein
MMFRSPAGLRRRDYYPSVDHDGLQGVKDPRGPIGMTASLTERTAVYPATHRGPDQVNVIVKRPLIELLKWRLFVMSLRARGDTLTLPVVSATGLGVVVGLTFSLQPRQSIRLLQDGIIVCRNCVSFVASLPMGLGTRRKKTERLVASTIHVFCDIGSGDALLAIVAKMIGRTLF